MHTKDELYDSLRGPATNMHVLATAFSDPETGGTGENEPMLMAINYGNGRVFHTALGHGPEAMADVGFIVTLQRGTEWAATGKVTQKGPADFPAPDHTSVRQLTP
jgi:type 1 glutamine amidotransferase